MLVTLIRSATLTIEFAGKRILFDPYLAAKGEGKSYLGNSSSPLVDLPLPIESVLAGVDAVLVSHLHSDHFDDVARASLSKKTAILCHVRDAESIQRWGFSEVIGFDDVVVWQGIRFAATDGLHGPPEVLDDLGSVSGFVLQHPDEPTLYLAGDTIFCDAVEQTIHQYRPDVIVVHAAGATWKGFGPIIMDEGQVLDVLALEPRARVIATHLDTVDHATTSRQSLLERAAMWPAETQARLLVPEDGEQLAFPK